MSTLRYNFIALHNALSRFWSILLYLGGIMWNIKNPYAKTCRKEYYTIGEIEKMYGFGADSLRYFEKKGLINPKRGANQYRYYSETERVALDITRSLRDINLSVEQIGEFLRNRTVQSTLDMLHNALNLTTERIRLLQTLSESICTQIQTIETVSNFLFDIVTVNQLPDRAAFLLNESYITTEEYTILRMELTRSNDLPFSVIGDYRIGSAISTQRIAEGDFTTYDCIFALDNKGSFTIPGGIYLTIRYRGAVQSEKHIRLLIDYAERNGFKIVGPFLEWSYLDIHTTDLQSEAVMENQVLVEL